MNGIVQSTFEQQRWQLPRLQVRPVIVLGAILSIVLGTGVSLGSQRIFAEYSQAAAPATAAVAKSQSSTLALTPVTTPTVPTSPTNKPARAVAAVPACTPYGAGALPAALGLADAPDGLSQQIDSPAQYRIYGNDATTLRNQVRQCAPKTAGTDAAEFTAETTYQITWQYSYVSNESGLCSVVHAKVGLHVSQVMPLWSPTTSAQNGLSAQWQTFMNNLQTHENGHAAIDVQYAQMLLNDLNAFPATPCAQLNQSVKHMADSDVASLNQANDNYDSTTNHGATQGALLP